MGEEYGIAIESFQTNRFTFGDDLLTIHADGTVEGRMEDMGEAARLFVEFVRVHLAEHDRQVAARAWDEGRDASGHLVNHGFIYSFEWVHGATNPYREGEA